MASKKKKPISKGWREEARKQAAQSISQGTKTAYEKQWRWFTEWCEQEAETALPAEPDLVAGYLTARADQGWRISTIKQALAAISHRHVVDGHPSPRDLSPVVSATLGGLKRSLSSRPSQKAPLSADWLREMLDVLPEGLRGQRDRAILLVGFAGGFRRSELTGLKADDVQFHPQGVELLVRKSKTDQTGRGQVKVLAYGGNPATCPVRALEDWLELTCIVDGPVFRPIDRHENVRPNALTAHSIARMVKATAERAGLDSERFSGHSLRAGFVTAATMGGAGEAAVMDQTGHRSVEMVRRYTRRLDAWRLPASGKLGL